MVSIRKLFKRHGDVLRTDAIVIGIFVVVLVGYFIWQPDYINETEVQQLTERLGAWGPAGIIVFIITEVIIAPIPGGLIPVAIGVLYGFWPGWLYVFVGNMVGTTLLFFIARKGGRRLAQKLVSKSSLKKFDYFIHHNRFLIWIVYLIPLLPMDTVSVAAGVSNIKFKVYLRIITVGFAVHLFVLTYFGEQLVQMSHQARIGFGLLLMVFVVGALTVQKILFRNRRKKN